MIHRAPYLQVNRLAIVKGGKSVYDENFHQGLNIIQGDNSTGKSTIADCLFYVLGGDLGIWKPEALSCDAVLAEIDCTGGILTLRREIADTQRQPMWISFTTLDKARLDAVEWLRFPYNRSSERESFSQVIFRHVGWPDVPADQASNITMHQIMRMLYVDQITPVTRIFRFESFDSAQRRQAIGDFLLGVYDNRIYEHQLRLRALEQQFDRLQTELRNIYDLLGEMGEALTGDVVDAARQTTNQELASLEEAIEALKSARLVEGRQRKQPDDGVVGRLQRDIQRLTRDISASIDRESQLEILNTDAAQLVAEIRHNLKQLDDGEATREVMGGISFHFCPACYAPIAGVDEHCCHLCRTPFEGEAARARFTRLKNELELQLRESTSLMEHRAEEREKLARLRQGLERVRARLSEEFMSLTHGYVSEIDAEIEHAIAKRGYLRRELEELDRRQAIVAKVEEMSRRKAEINEEMSLLRDRVAAFERERDRNEEVTCRRIKAVTSSLLERDLPSEKEFMEHPDVHFDFGEDRVEVGGRTAFSASSLVIIRNSFHLAMLYASTQLERMNYPRFLLMDNIEDKGMTEERSHNFQRVISTVSGELRMRHQIIFTTSMIAPELRDSDKVVGGYYTFERKTLRI